MRKWLYIKNVYLKFELGYLPAFCVSLSIEDDITFHIGFFIQLYFSIEWHKLLSWFYKHKITNRALHFYMYFNDGWPISVSLFSDSMGWKKSDWKWYVNIGNKFKGKFIVAKKVIEERNIEIPMPEKTYQAHAVLADWTWNYPRWFSNTIRRCTIEIPEGLPHAGKGENSWDCGDDATLRITIGQVNNIPEAIGILVGSVLSNRVKYGGWKDYKWDRKPSINM